MAFLRFAARCFLEKDLTSVFSSFLDTTAFSVICSGDAGAPRPKQDDKSTRRAGRPSGLPYMGASCWLWGNLHCAAGGGALPLDGLLSFFFVSS